MLKAVRRFASLWFQYETLVVFDTSKNQTTTVDENPALVWAGSVLPNDVPEHGGRPFVRPSAVELKFLTACLVCRHQRGEHNYDCSERVCVGRHGHCTHLLQVGGAGAARSPHSFQFYFIQRKQNQPYAFSRDRQNRKERLMQKKWSHIEAHLIGPLDEKEVSLKVNTAISLASLSQRLVCNYM